MPWEKKKKERKKGIKRIDLGLQSLLYYQGTVYQQEIEVSLAILAGSVLPVLLQAIQPRMHEVWSVSFSCCLKV